MGARTHQGRDSTGGFAERRRRLDLLVDDLHATVREIAADLPAVYGLAGFPAPGCTVGGWAALEDRAERIALVYGGFTGPGPLAAVHTTRGSAEFLTGGLRYGEGTLDPAFALTPEDELPVLRRFEHFAPAPDLALPVGGAQLMFHRRESGTAWYAWADSTPAGPGVVIEVAGVEPSEIGLVDVCDLTPYLDGHRALLREASWAG
ncbi:MAG TPA: hypothetical protein VGX23_27305 [Actinocrinis sp.]|nr:hypothetical protein [Actinocrinis sp.]